MGWSSKLESPESTTNLPNPSTFQLTGAIAITRVEPIRAIARESMEDFLELRILQLSFNNPISWLVNLPPCKVPPWQIRPS